jgi:DNA polymerase III delta subunit
MRVRPEDLILEKYSIDEKNSFFLLCGNEDTFIDKINELIINKLKKNGYLEVIKINESVDLKSALISNTASLFSKKKIFVLSNQKKLDLDTIKKIDLTDKSIIIIDKKIKNSSKIKKYVETHSNHICITCYKLSRESKKGILEYHLRLNKIEIERDAYWYFVDNSDDRYMLFENEITKIIDFNNRKITLKDLISLISKNSSEDIDKLFFTILSPQKEIIYTSLANINSTGDSFFLLQRIKYYLNLIISIENINDINKVFPKYLFMKKDKFVEIYKKLNYERISKIIILIKKTEILLRKNTAIHLIIIQRFLLNLKKTIG